MPFSSAVAEREQRGSGEVYVFPPCPGPSVSVSAASESGYLGQRQGVYSLWKKGTQKKWVNSIYASTSPVSLRWLKRIWSLVKITASSD